MTQRSDADLVTAARAGDRSGFAELYERYATPVHDFALRLTRSAADAADLTQDTFITALERLEQLREPDRFRSWVFQIAYRRSLDRMSADRRTRVTDDESVLAAVDPDRMADPSRATEASAVASLVWEVASSLDARTYTLLDLHVRRDLQAAEVAEVLGVTPNNASVQLHRMRKTVETAMLTYLLARLHRRDCDALDALLYGTSEPFTPSLRQQVDAHVVDCDTCQGRRRALVAPMQAFAALAAVEAPPRVASAVEAAMDAHFGGMPPPRWRRGATVGALLLLLLVGAGVGVDLLGGPDGPAALDPVAVGGRSDPPTPATAGGVLPDDVEVASEAMDDPVSPAASPHPSPTGGGPTAGPAPSPTPTSTVTSPSPSSPASPSPSPTTTTSATPGPGPSPSSVPTPAGIPPTVTITAPADRFVTCPGTTLRFSGSAEDPDGSQPIPGSALAWASDLDGPLGFGSVVTVALDGGGTHLITLTAEDEDGLTGSDTVQVRVRPQDDATCFSATILSPEASATILRDASGGCHVDLDLTGGAQHSSVPTSQLSFLWYVDGRLVARQADGVTTRQTVDCRAPQPIVVRLEVRDPDGRLAEDSVEVTPVFG